MKTKKECAQMILSDWNCYEVKPVKLSTIMRKMFKLSNGNWHVTGNAHDYTVSPAM